MDLIVKVVLGFADAEPMTDARGKAINESHNKAYGQAVVTSGQKLYLMPEVEIVDETMKKVIGGTAAQVPE
jgi:hypothetical protein